MIVRLRNGEYIDVNASYGARLIEQGRAVLPEGGPTGGAEATGELTSSGADAPPSPEGKASGEAGEPKEKTGRKKK